jgi:hypothetical protein
MVRSTLSLDLSIEFYWRAMFDPKDELFKLVDRFNRHAVNEIASQLSQISILLERHHNETYTAIEKISREVELLRQEAKERSHEVRRASDLLEKMTTGASH